MFVLQAGGLSFFGTKVGIEVAPFNGICQPTNKTMTAAIVGSQSIFFVLISTSCNSQVLVSSG